MCKENLYDKMEKLEAPICRCVKKGLKLCPVRGVTSLCSLDVICCNTIQVSIFLGNWRMKTAIVCASFLKFLQCEYHMCVL